MIHTCLNLILIEIEQGEFDLHDCICDGLNFFIIFEDCQGFSDMEYALVPLVRLYVAEGEVVVALSCLLMASAADLEDVHQRALREGDCILELRAS